MLTNEENEMMTRVGPGTPAGELLRRYWHPIAVVKELTEEQPTKFVRVLGEALVLFRDTSGRLGLLADRCCHRGASLSYGRVEERGIRGYPGWLTTLVKCPRCRRNPTVSKFIPSAESLSGP